ncbi:Uncharacterized protein dnm_008930 [Desulfonema magnum]|uniref:Uncharacterized protein n=1 Tax=Desulfonema magnum TaxID=45655 RepID=A0A975BGK3_9BACT|nr:Uncharacterized protein dnm_008930 [Desulfonema magnum]
MLQIVRPLIKGLRNFHDFSQARRRIRLNTNPENHFIR